MGFLSSFHYPWLPNAYHSSRHHILIHGKKKEREERGSKKAFPCVALFFYQWRKDMLRRLPVDFPLHSIDHGLLTWAYLLQGMLGKQLLSFSSLHTGERQGVAIAHKHVYMYVYAHTHRYVSICSLLLMGKDSRSICLSLETACLPAC